MRNGRLALMIKECAESFGALMHPTRSDCARVERMVSENFELVDFVGQRALVGVFANLEAPPSRLIAYFCHEAPSEIAAPFISQSRAIDQAVCLAIIARHGAGARTRAIARRADLGKRVTAELRTLDDAAIDRALDLRQRTSQTAAPMTIDQHAEPLSWASLSAIADLALQGEKGLFATALADITGLSMESAAALCDDPSSRNMLFALRFSGFDTELALSVVIALAGEMASTQSAQSRFRSHYGAISIEEAADRVRGWKLDELATLQRLRQHLANDAMADQPLRRRA